MFSVKGCTLSVPVTMCLVSATVTSIFAVSWFTTSLGASQVKSETGPHAQRAGRDGRTRQALRGRQVPGPGTHAGGLSGRRQRRSPHPLPEPQVQAEASPGFSLAVSRRPQGRVLGQRLGRGARGPPPVSERDPSPASPPRAPDDLPSCRASCAPCPSPAVGRGGSPAGLGADSTAPTEAGARG